LTADRFLQEFQLVPVRATNLSLTVSGLSSKFTEVDVHADDQVRQVPGQAAGAAALEGEFAQRARELRILAWAELVLEHVLEIGRLPGDDIAFLRVPADLGAAQLAIEPWPSHSYQLPGRARGARFR
jgi:hypothetical protein